MIFSHNFVGHKVYQLPIMRFFRYMYNVGLQAIGLLQAYSLQAYMQENNLIIGCLVLHIFKHITFSKIYIFVVFSKHTMQKKSHIHVNFILSMISSFNIQINDIYFVLFCFLSHGHAPYCSCMCVIMDSSAHSMRWNFNTADIACMFMLRGCKHRAIGIICSSSAPKPHLQM